ncbi:hypothetical protein T484DRAFT_1796708, partial [Baffinella frigidus]
MGQTESRGAGWGQAPPVVAAKAVKLDLDLERGKMGKLIGPGGKTIQGIQQRVLGVQLRTPNKDETGNGDYKFVPVTIIGRSDEAFKAAFLVNDVSPVCLAVLTAQMKPADTPLLLSSERIVNLQKEVNVDTLRLPKKHDKLPKVVIEGFLEDVVKAYTLMSGEFERAAQEAHHERESSKLKALSQARMGGEGEADGEGDKGGKGARGAGGKRGGAPGVGEPPREVVVKEMELTEEFKTLLTKGRTMDNLTRDSRTKVSISVVADATVLRIE